MKKVAIIGAGITGLVTAFYLKKAGIPVTIFEKTNHIGGVMKTESKNGFLFERGPNSGVLSNMELVELFEDLKDDCQLEIADKRSKKRLIWKANNWHALPSSIKTAITTSLFTFGDKLKVLGEPFRKKGTNPNENLADMVKRRLGKSFLEYAIDPFISGIYAGDPAYLIPKYALPKLYNLEQDYGSFIKGAIAKKKTISAEEAKKVTKEIFSFNGGLKSFINALVKNIGKENIILNSNISVIKTEKAYTIEDKEYTNIISTVNASNISKILPFISKSELENIENLKYAKIIGLSIGFSDWKGIKLDAFGGLIPMKEQKNILGALFMSSQFKNRAPENGALFTVFVGGTRKENLTTLNDDEIKKIVAKDFNKMMQLKEFNPDLFEIARYNKAIAQYGIDSKNRFEAIKNIENNHKNLILAGSISNGIGIADRVKQAVEIAKKIAKSE